MKCLCLYIYTYVYPCSVTRDQRGVREQRDAPRHDSTNENEDRVPRSRHPDNQQVFVGNLPHNITEQQLKTYFEGTSTRHR